jgi:hypothetical protein
MTTPPRRMPAETQIATRVRVGKVCVVGVAAVDAVGMAEAKDEEPVTGRDVPLVSNDYGRGSAKLLVKKRKNTTHHWAARRREPKGGSGERDTNDCGATTN